MEIEKILSISGKPGLYYLVGQSRGGVLVESLTDGKRIPVSINKNISALSDIAIYTYTEEVRLVEVFRSIHEAFEGEDPKPKASEKDLLDQFRRAMPEFDEDRVYPSHIKKVFSWYNTLNKAGKLEDLLTADVDSEEDSEEE
jgi:hypothetical protein